MNWVEKLQAMSKEEITTFALLAMGLLSVNPPYSNKTPDELFDYINNIETELKEINRKASAIQ